MKRNARIAAAAVVLSVSGLLLWKSQDVRQDRSSSSSQSSPKSSPNESPGNRPRVDIVFALDTTGSMGGLIAGAKSKIWEIARKAQEGQPAPEVRIGLVAYRDKGDDYETQVFPLTPDLDAVYAKLTSFQAGGGGDGPEHVLHGLDDAVGASWSQAPNAVKLVYLVGDAPPHFDYDDGITLDSVLTKAQKQGVRVSAIRCGSDSATLTAWTQIAERTNGEVATIEQQGGVVAVATPYDADLARLNARLARTEVHWGSAGEQADARRVVEDNMAAPAAAQADRAGFYAARAAAASASPSAGPIGATKKDLAADPSKLAAVPTSDLPPEMRAMSDAERTRFVADKAHEREEVLAQITELNAKRSEHLKTTAPPPKPGALDSKVYDSLKKAGAKSGISY